MAHDDPETEALNCLKQAETSGRHGNLGGAEDWLDSARDHLYDLFTDYETEHARSVLNAVLRARDACRKQDKFTALKYIDAAKKRLLEPQGRPG